jgi:N-acylneuraminate cytidylyltransferase
VRIAVIPARSGSKRVPCKNVKIFAGQPILAVTASAILKTNIFDRVIVSTDSQEIADVAKSAGVEVPFMRPAVLSDDYASTVDVMRHAVASIAEEGVVNDYCCIYPTAPYIRADDLLKLYQVLVDGGWDYVFPVAEYLHPIQRALRLGDEGKIEMVHPNYEQTRTQDLSKAYHDVGQFYWGRQCSWLSARGIFESRSAGVPVSPYYYRDINTLSDWVDAEQFYEFMEWRRSSGYC